jgi:hypothetical protein
MAEHCPEPLLASRELGLTGNDLLTEDVRQYTNGRCGE